MALNGCNVPDVHTADPLTRWLVISRACVFSMTITSGMIGILLAIENGVINIGVSLLSLLGLILAHAANNLINDWTDVRKGVDTEDYPRAQYSPHPILGGLTTPNQLLTAAILLTLLDGVIMIYLTLLRGPMVIGFAVGGLVLSLSYTGILKRIGLGELTAMIVWGPLMIMGTTFVIQGYLIPEQWLASLPYGLIVASVLVGKHVDKRDADLGVGVKSIPALLGQNKSLILNKLSFILFYVLTIGLVVLNITGPWILFSLFAIGRLRTVWKVYSEPKPSEPPEGWTVWPLWYVGWAMYFNRRAGELFVLGLFLNITIPKLLDFI